MEKLLPQTVDKISEIVDVFKGKKLVHTSSTSKTDRRIGVYGCCILGPFNWNPKWRW